MSFPVSDAPDPRAGTGVRGLDEVLGGGLPRDQVYLVEGDPGAGKTTLALQFLLEGVRQGERALVISLSETEAELRHVAGSHGWSLDGLDIVELKGEPLSADVRGEYTIFHPAEVELTQVMDLLLREVTRVRPRRVVFDSLSEIRLLAQNPLSYRRQILALKRHFAGGDATVLLLDDRLAPIEAHVQSLAHGVIELDMAAPIYGATRRRLRVAKMRGVAFREGFHDVKLVTGGLRVFPRLVTPLGTNVDAHGGAFGLLPSGITSLDEQLGGGIERGTSTLFIGPAGSGKSSLVMQYVCAAAARGERAAVYMFDETPATALRRAESLGMPLRRGIEEDLVTLRHVDPAELSPGELVHAIRDQVETGRVRVVAIDTLNGYLEAMPNEQFLVNQLHELLTYLGQRGVAALLAAAQQGLVSGPMQAPVDVSYLADTVVLLRYFEAQGRVRKAISVLKRRGGMHEDAIRELALGAGGVRVGKALDEFRGVLTGVPQYEGTRRTLMEGGLDHGRPDH